MKDFEFFVKGGDVKKQIPDKNLSDSIMKDSLDRLKYAKSSTLTESSAKYVYENLYESLREATDSILFLKGFKSFSHEATISFLQRFKEISTKEISEFDRMRRKRNGMKYYGKSCTVRDVKEVIEFADKMIKKIMALRENL